LAKGERPQAEPKGNQGIGKLNAQMGARYMTTDTAAASFGGTLRELEEARETLVAMFAADPGWE